MKNFFRIFIAPIFAIFCGLFCHIESAHAVDYPFSVTISGTSLYFDLSAQGTFYVNCGTGGTLRGNNTTINATISSNSIIRKNNTTKYRYYCVYSSAGTHTIQFGGSVTNYSTEAAISFYTNAANTASITSISGNLSTVFPYKSGNAANGAQPRFQQTFKGANNITSIPDTLFSGYTAASTSMFSETFSGCTGLRSIPENLFSNITTGATGAFSNTFSGCSNLTGFIPPTLFDGLIRNNAATNTFDNTFGDTGMLDSCPTRSTQYASNYTSAWGGKVSCTCLDGYVYENGTCAVDYAFSLTTSSISSGGTFEFSLSPQGTFYVDCGTGGTLSSTNSTANAMISGETINKTNTTTYTFKCTYSSAGTKTIRFGGAATNYNTSMYTAAISFNTSDANAALITSISGNLSAVFPYISGNAANGAQPRFHYTFRGANITSIPDTLFSGYTVASTYMFRGTFFGCTRLTSIPANLFFPNATSVSGADYMFNSTFYGCTGLTSIPENLFLKITSGAEYMFESTFSGCTGLTSIPANLFFPNATSVSGAVSMFSYTFYGCAGLTSIPANLFSKITSGAQSMFNLTFADCTGLTSIPANLFSKITSGAKYMFSSTFYGCSNLTGIIPPTLFDGLITNNAATNTFSGTFSSTGMLTSCPSGATQYAPTYTSAWGGKVSCTCSDGYYYDYDNDICSPYPFSLTTSSISSGGTFQFNLSAQGTFYVDCGTGGTLSSDDSTANAMIAGGIITKTNTTNYIFKCTYSSAGTKTIRFGGTATNYNTDTITATIAFYTGTGSFIANDANPALITSISGNLSTIFPYKSGNAANGAQPRFQQTFKSASITSIPDTLFSGYTVASTYMFRATFYNCTRLTSIPANLFFPNATSVSGADYMFDTTFYGCTGLTSIPANLFFPNATSVSGAGGMFSQTFYGCTGLTSIPANLFFPNATSVSGASYMFSGTFGGCTGLTSIPANLFSKITSGATYMFSSTFNSCTGLTSIPANLFFPNATSVSGAGNMFSSTFYGCTGLTSIPENLFSKITSGATSMFSSTFSRCSNLTGYIPPTLFDGLIKNNAATNTFSGTFSNTGMLTSCPSGMTQYAPTYTSAWGGKVSCQLNTLNVNWWNGNTQLSVGSESQSCVYGDTITVPTINATKNGYHFNGWKIKQ